MATTGWLNTRVQRLSDEGARKAAFVTDAEHYQFRVACTCPPSTSVVLRGGLMYEHEPTGNGFFVDDDVIDMTDTDQVQDNPYTFTADGNYLTYILTMSFYERPDPYRYWLYGSDVEYETAAEAEQELTTYWFNVRSIWNVHYPLCGLILRNNGILGTGYNILPIDPINRGRSYTWPRDMRPRAIALTG